MTPKAFDIFCGLGGFSEGFLAAGYRVFGFDNHRHEYGESRYPGQLILQDALTIHGSQLKDAAVIVASPPCQNYSYLAMPWSRSSDPENSKAAKALRKKWETEGPDNRLFDACFRIQREAISATGVECPDCDGSGVYEERLADCDKRDWPCEECKGTGAVHTRYIPLIVENVRGAVPWVGKQQAQFGSFYLWGDVAQIGNRVVAGRDLADIRAGRGRFGMGVAPERGEIKGHGSTWFGIQSNGDTYDQREVNPVSGQKREGRNFHTWALTGGAVSSPSYHGGDHETRGVGMGVKTTGHVNKRDGHGHTRHLTNQAESDRVRNSPEIPDSSPDGTKIGGDWFRDPACHSKHGSRSNARKAASAMIAKIPYALSRYIAEQHMPAKRSAHA